MTGTTIFRDHLRTALTEIGLDPSAEQVDQLTVHYESMIERNKVMNLTRIVEPQEAAAKHYADAAALLTAPLPQLLQDGINVLDVGTGAGLPAIVLAALKPTWNITAIDGTGKKAAFVEETAERAGLDNLEVLHLHSDHWKPETRFDIVCARAVGPLVKLLPMHARFATKSGLLVCYKGERIADEEWDEAVIAQEELNLAPPIEHAYDLTIGAEKMRRTLLIYKRAAQDHARNMRKPKNRSRQRTRGKRR